VSLESDTPELLKRACEVASKALLGKIQFIENSNVDTGFTFAFRRENDRLILFQDGKQTTYTDSDYAFFKYFNSMLRITVAENAVDTVFIHAGAVGWNGMAVIFPGRSFHGKTTLVAELCREGAVYYSDEYAVLNAQGLLYPFPRDLSLRSYHLPNDEVELAPDLLGIKVGAVPLSVGAVIISQFDVDSTFRPEYLTVGQGILETLPHTIPIRADPEMSLKILNLALKDAIFAKSYRGDVKRDAVAILAFLDKHLK
jgi:hypothetical protein